MALEIFLDIFIFWLYTDKATSLELQSKCIQYIRAYFIHSTLALQQSLHLRTYCQAA